MAQLRRRARRLFAFLCPPLAKLSTASSPTSAYIHLPFCAQRCAYCAFPVVVSGRSALPDGETQIHPLPPQSHQDYVDLLCREIRAVANRFQPHEPAPQPLSTLYLGGGTPSLLHPTLLDRVVQTVRETFGLRPDAELTCEMDPATFTPRTAADYRALGVNRASVGAQTFDDTQLATCGRVHVAADIPRAIQALRRAGFDNISLDLISGLPGQTLASWRESLYSARDLSPEHISAYDLTLEPGTAFGKQYIPGERPLPSEALAAEMMTVTAHVLGRAGYEHYEVSNFATKRDGEDRLTLEADGTSRVSPFRSQHNMVYWRNESFYAFGLGATSVVDGFRFARPRRMSDYRRYVEKLCKGVTDLTVEQVDWEARRKRIVRLLYPHMEPLTEREQLEDYLINSFRLLVEGVRLHELQSKFGQVAKERLAAAVEDHAFLVSQGSLAVEYAGPRRDITVVRLTEQGSLVENSVLSTLLQEGVWKYPVDTEAAEPVWQRRP